MQRRGCWVVAWSATALVGAAFAIVAAGEGPIDRLRSEPVLSLGAVGVGFSLAGAAVVGHQRRIGLTLLVAGVTTAVALVAHEWGYFALVERDGELPFGRATAVLGWTLWAPGFALALGYLPLVFPDGTLLGRRWRPLVAAVAVGGVLAGAGSLATALLASDADLYSGETPGGRARDVVVVADVGRALLLLCGAMGVVTLCLRYARAERITRRQMLWGLVGVALMVVCLVLASIVQAAWLVLEVIGVLAVPTSIVIAIRRSQLWDIERLVSRAAVYLATSGVVAFGYLVVIAIGATVFRERSSIGAAVVVAIAIAIAFQPAREALQARVDRIVYGNRRHPGAALVSLHSQIRLHDGRDGLLDTLVQSIRDDLRLGYVAVHGADGSAQPLAAAGVARDGHRLPVHLNGEVVAHLVGAPSPGDRLTDREIETLTALASQVGLVMYAAGLVDDLDRSREALVVAREEERRRLRRDLHDGVGPALAGLSLQAAAASELWQRDPERAAGLAQEVAANASTVTAEVRRLVYGLRPPALDEFGLLEAVRRYGDALALDGRAESAMTTTIDADGPIDPLPAAVAVAAYRIATEAVLNARRHAGASACEVCFERRDASLVVAVADDGTGIDPTSAPGVGILSMRERAEELGGTIDITSGPTGTRVEARLPLP